MNTKLRLGIAFALAIALAIAVVQGTFRSSGTWGTCQWHIDDGVLTVEAGKGQDGMVPGWNSLAPLIEEVRVEEGVELPPDSSRLCEGLSCAKLIDFYGCDFSKVESAYEMLQGCKSLEELHVSWWDLSSVTDMSDMFVGCESLEKLDVSAWDTSSVTNMSGAFQGCTSLAKLDVSAWDTSSVTDMGWMFFGCKSLPNLNLSTWDTSQVKEMPYMFYGCESLERIRIGKKYRMTNEDAFPSPTGRHSMWYCIKDGTWYSHEDIVSEGGGIACTYTNHKPVPQTGPSDA